MKRERIIKEVENAEDAKKVEETVKTGYAESSVETITHWIGVEEDLVSSYESLAARERSPARRNVFQRLGQESKSNTEKLAAVRRSLEELDRARIERIESLSNLGQ